MMKRALLVALLVLTALSLGCGKTERLPKPADKATSGVPAAALPDEFPKDVPVLRGATLKASIQQGDKIVVHLASTSSVADAARFYETELKNHGWKIESTSRSNDIYTVSAKKEKTLCGVTVSREAKGTLIRMAISQTPS
jgi:hypothetical protein